MTSSIVVWSRVYFYGVVGVIASLAFFSSPGKEFLKKKIEQHNNNDRKRLAAACSAEAEVEEQEPARSPVLGLPNDPEKEFEGAVQEIKAEIEARRSTTASASASASAASPKVDDRSAQVKKAAEERIRSERKKLT